MSMNRYYANSTVSNWLRCRVFKIEKPTALPWGDWDTWRDETKAKHPIGWFFTETLPAWMEKPAEWLIDPVNNVRYYCKNRWSDQSHVLPTGLEKGRYYDLDSRMLHANFTALVDFVEVEKAWMQVVFSDADKKKYKIPWHLNNWLTRWTRWRCPEAGIDHLYWEMGLNHPDLLPDEKAPAQAITAREIFDLYRWWTNVFPNRPDPYDVSGWTDICEEKRQDGKSIFDKDNDDPAWTQRKNQAHKKLQKIEEDYTQEEEDMLIRLIKIRKSLWT